MGKLIQWPAPDTKFAYTHTEVWRANATGGSFAELSSTNIIGYTADGIPVATTYANDRTGITGMAYKIRFYDNVNGIWSEFSDEMVAQDFRGYCTVEDVRSFSDVQTTEYADGPLQLIIDSVTAEIDMKTGRTWQGIQTVTDELYDTLDMSSDSGYSGLKTLQLNQVDVKSLTALSVDTNQNNTFTTVTPARALLYGSKGQIVLDEQKHSNLEVSYFPIGRQVAKVSYTYGNADPTADVRYLAILMVMNQIYLDPIRYNKAQAMLRNLTRRLYNSV